MERTKNASKILTRPSEVGSDRHTASTSLLPVGTGPVHSTVPTPANLALSISDSHHILNFTKSDMYIADYVRKPVPACGT